MQTQDFSKSQALKLKLLDTVDNILASDVARLMVMVYQEESLIPSQAMKGSAFYGTMNGSFGYNCSEGAYEGIDDVEWVLGKDKPSYYKIYVPSPINSKITGANARKEDGETHAARHIAMEDLEADRHDQGQAAGPPRGCPSQPPHQGQTGGPEAAH